MPLEEVIAGFTGVGFASIPPVIPGLQAFGMFGTGGDGKNGNRAPGGPAFTNLTNPPVYSPAWGTFNTGAATPTQGIDTGVAETLAIQQGGWTLIAVARYIPTTGQATLFACNSTGLTIAPAFGLNASKPTVWHQQQAFAFDPATAMIDLTGIDLSQWRMYALTYSAGTAARPYTLFDVTGNQQNTTGNASLRTAGSHFTFGQGGNTLNPNGYAAFDAACELLCTQPLTMAQLQSIRTWLLGVEAVRQVTGF